MNLSENSFLVPKTFGFTNCIRECSSTRLFCIRVPVSIFRLMVKIPFTVVSFSTFFLIAKLRSGLVIERLNMLLFPKSIFSNTIA